MDDMTPFERTLAAELDEMAGPGRHIDAMAMARTVSTTSTGWRSLPVSSAARFVVAGAILALGGLLVAGLQSQRGGDELIPAAVSPSQTPSPSPVATGPLAGMIVEEVEPGVVRVIDDGAGHDLDERHPTNRFDMDGITVGADGSVWLLSTYSGSDNQVNPEQGFLLWRLGRPGMTEGIPEGDLVPLADGSLLIVGDTVTRFDGQAFVPDDGPKQRSLGGGATLWLIEPDQLMGLVDDGESVARPGQRLAVIWDGDGWLTLSQLGRQSDSRGIQPCSGGPNGVICVGQLLRFLEGTPINQVAMAPDGAIWAVGGNAGENGGLYRITP